MLGCRNYSIPDPGIGTPVTLEQTYTVPSYTMTTLQAETSSVYPQRPHEVGSSYDDSIYGSTPCTCSLPLCPWAVRNSLSLGNANDPIVISDSDREEQAVSDVPQVLAHLPLLETCHHSQAQGQVYASAADKAAERRKRRAERQRIRRLDERYRAIERARHAERQRRRRANDEYRANEVFRNRLRRRLKSQKALKDDRARCGSFEELSWLQDSFTEEEWSSLKSLWYPPTKRAGSKGKKATASGDTNAEAAVRPVPAPLYSTDQDSSLVTLSSPPGQEPRSWVRVSVPHSALTAAPTMTLAALLSSDAEALCALPNGQLVPAKEAQLRSLLAGT